jgi:hypothetical protein
MTAHDIWRSSRTCHWLAGARDSSIGVRIARRVGLVTFLRALRLDIQTPPPPDEFAQLGVAVEDSRVAQALARLLAVRRLWRDSQLRRPMVALTGAWPSLPAVHRLRAVALLLLTLVLTHLVLTGVSAPAATSLARQIWLAIVATLSFTALAARPLTAAWNDWRGRAWRRPPHVTDTE